jgi:hypothetical protein
MASDTLIQRAQQSASQDSASRMVGLWAALSEEMRLELLDIAEPAARGDDEIDLQLTPEEHASIETARLDFAEGRTMTHDEVLASMTKFLRELP